ncbi:MAG: type II toxin-antitoxin system VapC family toxin [Kiritimatiellaeota bacterium]|nr:type II toxin-antitoxin system VapC family toxin [Kiritimatiellota bacterium]
MVGIDTNVLIRYLAQDDERQSAVATAFFENEVSPSNKGFVCSIVLCETVWVLQRCYAVKRHGITEIVGKLLSLDALEIEHSDCATLALSDFSKGTADFSDYYLARVNKERYHVSETVTFDEKTMKSALFRLLSS